MQPPQHKLQNKMRDSNMSQEQAQTHWTTIKDAVRKIYNKEASSLSYEELYRTAYNMVLHKHGELLYNNVKAITIELLGPIVQQLSVISDENLLKTINEIWANEKLCIMMIKDILMYMDRHYVPKLKLLSVEHLQMSQFKNQIILNNNIKQKLISRILQDIRQERDGVRIEKMQLRASILMLVEVGISNKKVYEQEFERPFIKETESYYRQESNQFILINPCSAFLQQAKQRQQQEVDRLIDYLDQSTENNLLSTFRLEYIQQHAQTLLTMENSGLVSMIKHNHYQDIRLMFEMFEPVTQAFTMLKKHLSDYIINEGNHMVRDVNKKPEELVQQLIALRERLIQIHVQSFCKDASIDIAIKNSFENFINQDNRTAVCLVHYLDELFKKGFKGASEQVINDNLDKVIQLFRYLTDKDIFEGYYKQSLAKRLLEQKSVSEDAEKQLVLKLKEECGFQFTQKLEVMFKDIKMSEESIIEFRNSQQARNMNVELGVKILTTGNWPNDSSNTPIAAVVWPLEIRQCMTAFTNFYMNKHTGRLLHWKNYLGSADLRANLGESYTKHELTVYPYQMCILLLFNDYQNFTYQQLLQLTNIADTDIKCNIIPLVSMKIINKIPNTKEFKDDDIYILNPNFKSASYKIKVSITTMKDTKQNQQNDVQEKVEEDRKHLIEATIVKVMKTRKRIDHNALIQDVSRILLQKFNPDPMMIKKRVESLIEREYLERDTEDRKFYKYIA